MTARDLSPSDFAGLELQAKRRDSRWNMHLKGCPAGNAIKDVHERDARNGVCRLCGDGPGCPYPAYVASHRTRFAETTFAELDEHPCSPKESVLLNLGTILLALSPVLIIIAFKVL